MDNNHEDMNNSSLSPKEIQNIINDKTYKLNENLKYQLQLFLAIAAIFAIGLLVGSALFKISGKALLSYSVTLIPALIGDTVCAVGIRLIEKNSEALREEIKSDKENYRLAKERERKKIQSEQEKSKTSVALDGQEKKYNIELDESSKKFIAALENLYNTSVVQDTTSSPEEEIEPPHIFEFDPKKTIELMMEETSKEKYGSGKRK